MTNEIAISVNDGPVDQLVRIHAERPDCTEPDVRYLRRYRPGWKSTMPLQVQGSKNEDECNLKFGNVHVYIQANENDIRIVLCEALWPQAVES